MRIVDRRRRGAAARGPDPPARGDRARRRRRGRRRPVAWSRPCVEHRPDVSIVDVRMPPSHTDEGLRAAVEARAKVPGTPVLVLSQYVEVSYADDLLADGAGGGRLPAQGPGLRGRRVPRRRCAGWPAAARCSTRRWSAQLLVRRRRDDPLRTLTAARARGARPDGRGPLEHRDRPAAGGHRGRGGEARPEHLHQARPAARRRAAPPGPGRPGLPARAEPTSCAGWPAEASAARVDGLDEGRRPPGGRWRAASPGR